MVKCKIGDIWASTVSNMTNMLQIIQIGSK